MSLSRPYTPTGDLTIATAKEFKAELIDMISEGKSGTLDLAGVRRMDAAALQVMIAAERTGRIALTSLSQPVRMAIEVIGYIPASGASDKGANGNA